MVKALALAALLAPALAAPAAAQQDSESSKTLQLRDAAKQLSDAETAVAHGGGADAYEARADAKRSLGKPYSEYIADYAEAARQDPKKYGEKFRGVMEQQQTAAKHEVQKFKRSSTAGQKDANILAKILFFCALAVLLFIASLVLLRGRARDG